MPFDMHRRFAVGFALSVGLSASSALAQHSLTGENARDIARVTTTTIEQANKLRETASIDAVKNLMPHLSMEANDPLDVLLAWHLLALNVTSVDHTAAPTTTAPYHEQFGPHRTSRALAIVHLAMFEAANGFAPKTSHFASYINAKSGSKVIGTPPTNASEAAAIIEAAYGTLVALYPGQLASLQVQHDKALAPLDHARNIAAGRAYGETVAGAVLALRDGDGSELTEPRWGVDFVPLHQPVGGAYPAGQWQVDPVSNIGVALGGNWPHVKPFVMTAGSQFRDTLPPPPPASMSDRDYKAAYEEVLEQGGDERLHTPRQDTPDHDHYFWAKFWAYDATAGLCAPVRLYDQIGDEVLQEYGSKIAPHATMPDEHPAAAAEVGRYYALLNLAMADAAIAAWDAKYYYQYWRPVTGIRYQEAIESEGARTELWYPLGAQQTNSTAVINITPPFPSYPSGHAVFGGAFFQVLRAFVPNDTGFKFQSDEFNGKNRPKDTQGNQQPNIDVYNFIRCQDGDNTNTSFCTATVFPSFADAEEKNAMSRVWMGVHWHFDATRGSELGEKIGTLVYSSVMAPDPS